MMKQFIDQGFVGPIRVLSDRECRQFLQSVRNPCVPAPLAWSKGHAATSRAFYEMATHRNIIETVSTLLGDDVMLWGASIVVRPPGRIHAWHSDIESCDVSGQTVTVWLGLEHSCQESCLELVPYSHHYGITVQQVRHQAGLGRDNATSEDMVRWAQRRDSRSRLTRPNVKNGDAIFFDGRLWHGSQNRSRLTRRALLLQFATPDARIRMSDQNYRDWPMQKLASPQPPCLLVRGRAVPGVNRIVPPPTVAGGKYKIQLSSLVYPLRVPLAPDPVAGWKPYRVFRGSTADMRDWSCHASVLKAGHCPHPPHQHKEEELLLVLAGEVDLFLPDESIPREEQRKRLQPGQFVYYPAYFPHTLQAAGVDPANYLMFKWHTDARDFPSPLTWGQFDLRGDRKAASRYSKHVLFQGPTACLRNLHCHHTTLAPGAGYPPHIDAYDVAIVVLEGEVETLGERVGPHGVIFYRAGEPHGMHNPGNVVAKYVVFEFHANQTTSKNVCPGPSLFTKLTDPQRWKRKLRHLFGRTVAGKDRSG